MYKKISCQTRHLPRKQHPGMRHRQRQMLLRGGKGTLLHGQQTVVRSRQAAMQQPAHAEGTGAADRADLAWRQRPALRFSRQQLCHALSHGPTPKSITTQVPGHAAAAVRRTQRHDAPRFLLGMLMEQRADQDATEAVSHEVHGVGIEGGEKARQPFGIRAQIAADGRIGKRMNRKTLAPQSARERK